MYPLLYQSISEFIGAPTPHCRYFGARPEQLDAGRLFSKHFEDEGHSINSIRPSYGQGFRDVLTCKGQISIRKVYCSAAVHLPRQHYHWKSMVPRLPVREAFYRSVIPRGTHIGRVMKSLVPGPIGLLNCT